MEKNTSINIRRCENWQQLVPKKFGFDHTPVTIVIALATHFKLLTEIICLCLLASLRYTLCHHHFDYFPSLLEAFSSFNGDTSIKNRVNGCYRDQEYHKSNRVKSSLVKKKHSCCVKQKKVIDQMIQMLTPLHPLWKIYFLYVMLYSHWPRQPGFKGPLPLKSLCKSVHMHISGFLAHF